MAPPCGSGAAAGLSQSCRACSGPGARAAAAAALIHAPPAVVDGTRLEWDRWREAARPRRLQGSHGVLSALVATAGRASSAARRWPAGPYKTDAPLRWAGVRRGGRAGSAWHWDAACWLASSSPARPATAPSVHAWRGPGCLRRNGASQVRLGRAREPAGILPYCHIGKHRLCAVCAAPRGGARAAATAVRPTARCAWWRGVAGRGRRRLLPRGRQAHEPSQQIRERPRDGPCRRHSPDLKTLASSPSPHPASLL
jgi:hypothetical protein